MGILVLSVVLLSGVVTVSSGSSCINAVGPRFIGDTISYSGYPSDLDAGSRFTVTGSVDTDAKEFHFVLNKYWTEIIFQMSVNFTAGQVEFVSANYSDPDASKTVQPEKRSLGPFARGDDFAVDILAVDEKSYTITVNNEEFFNFSSQMSIKIDKRFGVEGDITLDLVQLDGEDLPHNHGAIANISDWNSKVSVGDKIIVDLTTLSPEFLSAFYVNLCYTPRENVGYDTDCPSVKFAVKKGMHLWSNPYIFDQDTTYNVQFELMEDVIQMSIDGNFAKDLSYDGLSPPEVNYVDIFGGVIVHCIRFEPADSS